MVQLKNCTKEAPKNPGVYHFIDENGLILYIGKAKNLKNRLGQYFLKELGRGPAIEQMVSLAKSVIWFETDSEIEAVILEAEHIKKFKPRYNVRLKDDKSFLVIRITKEEFPIVELVRFRNIDMNDKKAWYFGPYPSGELLRKSLNYLRKIFPFRDCSKTKFNTWRRKKRACIFGDIRVCSGPCNAWVNKVQYNKNIIYLKNFLRGKKQEVISKLEREMKTLSKNQRYEEAALIRNKLAALEHLKDVALGLRDDVFNNQDSSFGRIECYDISNIGGDYVVGSMVVFEKGKPATSEYRKFKIRQESEPNIQEANSDLARLKQVLERRFKNDWAKPDLIIIDGGEMQLKVANQVLHEMKLKIPAISISKGPKRQKNDFHYTDAFIAKYFINNTKLQNIAIAARDEAHRFAISYYRTLHRKSLLES